MECSGEELRLVMTVEDSNEEDDDAISNKSIAKTLKFTNIDTNSTSNSNSHTRNKNHQDNTVSKTTTTTTTTTGEGGRGKLRGPSDRKNQGVFEVFNTIFFIISLCLNLLFQMKLYFSLVLSRFLSPNRLWMSPK